MTKCAIIILYEFLRKDFFMNVIERIKHQALNEGNRIAISSDEEELSYKDLWLFSDKLAYYIQEKLKDDKTPLVVYGHKDPMMIVCFLACVKSGRAYCPVDISVPSQRVEDIISEVNAPIVFALKKLEFECESAMFTDEIETIIKGTDKQIDESHWVKGEDVFYIIFTSGSTGKPKGVQITLNCLDNFLKWSTNLGGESLENKNFTFINQAPFSFDLSVMDIYTSLYTGGTLWCLSKSIQADYETLLHSLECSRANVWVSTPSFANLCLAADRFNAELMPAMRLFLFCGEALANNTAQKLLERFPDAKVINTYGPTESTVAMTDIDITPEVLRNYNPLPLGKPKPGTYVFIVNDEGKEVAEGALGEIVIVGDTVSTGYFKRPDLTAKSFFEKKIAGVKMRAYRTGDEGYIKDRMLFYCGRIDLQIKLHGYRIELGDIENNFLKLPNVKNAVVIPIVKDDVIQDLAAFIVPEQNPESNLKEGIKLKKALSELLPTYMVPKKIVFKDCIPMTNNGKINRKLLKEEI